MRQQLTGLVVCGGQSSRMGRDKSMIDYHGKPQRYYLYEWLQQFCKEVYISCNAQQALEIPAAYNKIVDKEEWIGMGPMTALLSAHARSPDKNLLVLGCDYPLLQPEDIEALCEAFFKEDRTVAYKNGEGFIEPLIAIYHSGDLKQLRETLTMYSGSLNRFLQARNTPSITSTAPERLLSIDTSDQYEAALKRVK